jgi:amino acid adenylation domain-containing protein
LSRLLQEYVTRHVERWPDRVALVMEGTRLTYGELEEESNRLANLLKDVGCRRGDRVCLFMRKSPVAVVSMIAALKADCAYVPVDVASPAPRVEKIVESAEPRVVLVDEAAAGLLDEVVQRGGTGAAIVGTVEADALLGKSFECAFSASDWSGFSPERPAAQNSSADPAHILFTSGSTGTPKGVVITHANVLAFVEWATSYFAMDSADRISGHPPLHFDLSTFDIYGTFCAGAELHLVPAQLNLLPHKLAELIRSSQLTQWFAVPSVFTHMAKFDAVRQGDFPTLKRVLWCGEVLPTPVLTYWMQRLPHAVFTNLYGPTEATIASSYYTLRTPPASETDPIPIGTPCAGEELLILDEGLRPVPPGEIGELYIGGVGLSPGYWRDDEKTGAAFVPDPRAPDSGARIYRTGDLGRWGDDGLVYFLGRTDSQIKHRGYRIELGEIETALNALEDLRECAVVGVDADGFEGSAICCAYVAKGGKDLQPAEVRAELQKLLPAYMLPARWLILDELPKNVNGKIDRRALRERFLEPASEAAPVGRV